MTSSVEFIYRFPNTSIGLRKESAVAYLNINSNTIAGVPSNFLIKKNAFSDISVLFDGSYTFAAAACTDIHAIQDD